VPCVSYRTNAENKQDINALARLSAVEDSEIVRKSIQLYLYKVAEPNRDRNCTVVIDDTIKLLRI
jgi:hypothetical protein